jgi:hypothetical protein
MWGSNNMDEPENICTWKPESECKDCDIAGKLKCRFNISDQLHFGALFLTFAIPAIIGVILGGYGWFLLGWLLFAIVNFMFWEMYVLCRHCPFYAGRGTVLRCLANSGFPKVFKYVPGPMSRAERIQLIIIFIILLGYPFPFLVISGEYIMLGLAAWGVLIFLWTLHKYTCSKCINFSCPFNAVQEDEIKSYLEKNPVIYKAWRKNGFFNNNRINNR